MARFCIRTESCTVIAVSCVKVVDTVGSGDSFLAGLTYKLLNNAPPQEAIAFACALGALVASRHGATADISLEEVEAFMNPA